MSATSSTDFSGKASSSPTAAEQETQPAEAANEYEDAEKNYQPRSLKFWSVMIGMYLAMFLVALVSAATAPVSNYRLLSIPRKPGC